MGQLESGAIFASWALIHEALQAGGVCHGWLFLVVFVVNFYEEDGRFWVILIVYAGDDVHPREFDEFAQLITAYSVWNAP